MLKIIGFFSCNGKNLLRNEAFLYESALVTVKWEHLERGRENTKMEIGFKIKRLREEKGMSQEALAKKLHVTRQAVSKWESGKGCPDIINIMAISDYFGISMDELIKNSKRVEDKILVDNASKKWHRMVIVFLLSILVYIVCFAVEHKIFMLGLGISTLFVLGIELRVYFRKQMRK